MDNNHVQVLIRLISNTSRTQSYQGFSTEQATTHSREYAVIQNVHKSRKMCITRFSAHSLMPTPPTPIVHIHAPDIDICAACVCAASIRNSLCPPSAPFENDTTAASPASSEITTGWDGAPHHRRPPRGSTPSRRNLHFIDERCTNHRSEQLTPTAKQCAMTIPKLHAKLSTIRCFLQRSTFHNAVPSTTLLLPQRSTFYNVCLPHGSRHSLMKRIVRNSYQDAYTLG